jgi:hypothetical protein
MPGHMALKNGVINCLRIYAADIIGNIHTPEEMGVDDYSTERPQNQNDTKPDNKQAEPPKQGFNPSISTSTGAVKPVIAETKLQTQAAAPVQAQATTQTEPAQPKQETPKDIQAPASETRSEKFLASIKKLSDHFSKKKGLDFSKVVESITGKSLDAATDQNWLKDFRTPIENFEAEVKAGKKTWPQEAVISNLPDKGAKSQLALVKDKEEAPVQPEQPKTTTPEVKKETLY